MIISNQAKAYLNVIKIDVMEKIISLYTIFISSIYIK